VDAGKKELAKVIFNLTFLNVGKKNQQNGNRMRKNLFLFFIEIDKGNGCEVRILVNLL
jgi:hypothetical protein